MPKPQSLLTHFTVLYSPRVRLLAKFPQAPWKINKCGN